MGRPAKCSLSIIKASQGNVADASFSLPVRRIFRDLRIVHYLARELLWRRYCGSMIGVGWSLLNPLSYIGIMAFVFTIIMPINYNNYILYLASGIMPWTFICNSLLMSTRSLSSRKEVLETTTLNPIIFVLADVTAEFMVFLIGYSLVILLFLATHPADILLLLVLPFALLPMAVALYSFCVALAFLSTRFTDLPHLLQVVLTILFWIVPIVYHWELAPQAVQPFIRYNPISVMISPSQIILHGAALPTLKHLVAACLLAAISVLMAYIVYRNLRRETIFYL